MEIWNWALLEWQPLEDSYEDDDFDSAGKPVSICWTLLYILEEIKWNFHTKEDIPALLNLASTQVGYYDVGLNHLNEYYDTIDWAARRELLIGTEPYFEKK